jgi:hypothetical protein
MMPFFVFGGLLLFLISVFLLVEKWKKDKLLIWLMVMAAVLFGLGILCGYFIVSMAGPV